MALLQPTRRREDEALPFPPPPTLAPGAPSSASRGGVSTPSPSPSLSPRPTASTAPSASFYNPYGGDTDISSGPPPWVSTPPPPSAPAPAPTPTGPPPPPDVSSPTDPSSPVPLGAWSPGWTPGSVEELIAHAARQGWSEDFDRFKDNPNMIMSWIKNYWDPQKGMFRTAKTDQWGNKIEGFVEKPDDTPEGWEAWGQFARRTDGSSPSATSSSSSFTGNPADISAKADTLWDEILKLQSRYSPEIMQRLMAGAKRQGASAGARARERANIDAARRGMGRSLSAGALAEEAGRGAEADVVNPASSYFAAEKVKADQEDRITKLSAMQNWINSARQHIQAMTATKNQKDIALAQLDLAEKRLQQELQMQQNQFDFSFAYRSGGQFY